MTRWFDLSVDFRHQGLGLVVWGSLNRCLVANSRLGCWLFVDVCQLLDSYVQTAPSCHWDVFPHSSDKCRCNKIGHRYSYSCSPRLHQFWEREAERERDKQTDRETFNMYKEHQTESYIRCDIPSEYSFIEKKLKVFQNFWMILSVTRFEPFGMFQTCWSFFRWQFHRWQTCPARSWSLPTRFGSGGHRKKCMGGFCWLSSDGFAGWVPGKETKGR